MAFSRVKRIARSRPLVFYKRGLHAKKNIKNKDSFFRCREEKTGAIYRHFLHKPFFTPRPLRAFVEPEHV